MNSALALQYLTFKPNKKVPSAMMKSKSFMLLDNSR